MTTPLRTLVEDLNAILTRPVHPKEPLLMSALRWSQASEELESLRALSSNVTDCAAGVAREEGQARTNAFAGLQNSTEQLLGRASSVYEMFRAGRESAYEAAQLWGVGAGRAEPQGAAPAPLGGLSVKDLSGETKSRGSTFRSSASSMEKTMNKAVDKLSAAAREDPETVDGRRAVIDAAMDVRDAGHKLFSSLNGLLRRAHELTDRARQVESINAFRPPWHADPEIADHEV